MNDPKVEKLIESVGALAELSYAMFTKMMKAGFNQSEAMDMSKHMMTLMVNLAFDEKTKEMNNHAAEE